MEYFRMKLHTPNTLFFVSISSKLHVSSRSCNMIIFRNGGNGITMTHPYLRTLLEILENRSVRIYRLHIGTTICTCTCLFYFSSFSKRNKLGTIADTKNWEFTDKLIQVNLECFLIMNRIRTSTEDDTNDAICILRKLVVR